MIRGRFSFEVMVPNDAVPSVVPGLPQLGWLAALNMLSVILD